MQHCFRKALPERVVLAYLKLVYKEGWYPIVSDHSCFMFNLIAIDADRKFWANPNSYLQPPTSYYPYATHFILYNFKFTQPFDTEDLSDIKLAGMLHYKVCGMRYL